MYTKVLKAIIGIVLISTISQGNECENSMRTMNQHLTFANKFYDKNNPQVSDMHLKFALQAAEKARRSCGSGNVEAIEEKMIRIMKLQNM